MFGREVSSIIVVENHRERSTIFVYRRNGTILSIEVYGQLDKRNRSFHVDKVESLGWSLDEVFACTKKGRKNYDAA